MFGLFQIFPFFALATTEAKLLPSNAILLMAGWLAGGRKEGTQGEKKGAPKQQHDEE